MSANSVAISDKGETSGCRAASRIFNASRMEGKRALLMALMDRHFADMSQHMRQRFADVSEDLPAFERNRIQTQLALWSGQQGWGQINEVR